MILSKEEKEYFSLFNNLIVALYDDEDVKLLTNLCCQYLKKGDFLFSNMLRHLETMRDQKNDIQKAKYLTTLISSIITTLGNEHIILYDNIKELELPIRQQIKTNIAFFQSLDTVFLKNTLTHEIFQHIITNSFYKDLDIKYTETLKKIYFSPNTLTERDRNILTSFAKYFIFEIQHKLKYDYINLLIIDNQEVPIIENKYSTLQEFLFYAQRNINIHYKKLIVNNSILIDEDIISKHNENQEKEQYQLNITENKAALKKTEQEKVLIELCPFVRNREQVKRILYEIDERFHITGKCPKLDIATICLILKEKCSLFNKELTTFSDFKEKICQYYNIENPSYKKNDCLVAKQNSLSRFDELYEKNGPFWNLILRKGNKF